MDETENLWNKKTTDLTVSDSVKLAVITPILAMAGLAVFGAAANGVGALVRKFRKSTDETTTEPTN